MPSETGKTIVAGIGHYGVWFKHGTTYVILPDDEGRQDQAPDLRCRLWHGRARSFSRLRSPATRPGDPRIWT